MKYFDENQIRMFLSTLYSNAECEDDYVELRPINENDSKQLYVQLGEGIEAIVDKVKTFAGSYHSYIGFNPREIQRGRDRDISKLLCFWADIDAKDFDDSKKEAKEALLEFPLNPTIIVDSGSGYHAYWLLEEPWELNNQNNRDEAKRISEAIHTTINADSTFNLSRILRIPGTPNIKDPEDSQKTTENQSLWKPCVLESVSIANVYQLSDFYDVLPLEELERQAVETSVNLDGSCRLDSIEDLSKFVSPSVLNRAKEIPDRFEDDRSANDFWVAIKLFEAGLNDTEVYKAFTLFKEAGWDAGSKFEKRGDEYLLEHTLPNAKSKVNKLERKIEEVREADNKLQASKGIFEIIAKLGPIKQDQAIRDLQDAWGGKNEISIKVLRQKVREVSRQSSNQNDQFFKFTQSGGRKFVPTYLGNHLLNQYDFLYTANELYRYEDGVFVEDGERFLEKQIQACLQDDWKRSRCEEVVTYVKQKEYLNPKRLPENRDLINIKNGMLDIRDDELIDHSPDYKSLVQFPVRYDPGAECERLDQFMREVFPEDTIPLVWEHAGYILLQNIQLKKFLILVGKSNAGKSVFLNVLTRVLGEDNVASESLQQLGNDKYSTAQLFGKVANIYADLEEDAVERTGVIKMLTGGDRIRARVIYGEPFYFYNKAKLIFSANKLPPVMDYNNAFFKRLHIVRCPNQFSEEEADLNLIDKLTTEEAKSAFLNKAIEGAKRLLKNGQFTSCKSVEEEVSRYKLSSDSVSEFIYLKTNKVVGSWETKDTLYRIYKQWCKKANRRPVGKTKFTRRAKAEPNNLETFRPTNDNGQQVRAWKDIQLADISADSLEEVNITER